MQAMSPTRQFAISENWHLHFVFVKKNHIFVSALLALYVIAFLFFNVNNCALGSLYLFFHRVLIIITVLYTALN